jgi:hypothetical protein
MRPASVLKCAQDGLRSPVKRYEPLEPCYLRLRLAQSKFIVGLVLFIPFLFLPLPAIAQATTPRAEAKNVTKADDVASTKLAQSDQTQELIREVGESGRILGIAETASHRVNPPHAIAPGAAPLLTFRSLDRQARFRLGRLDLVVDDAGH